MAFIGSDVLEVTWNNPVVGQGTFFCKSGESSEIDLGGLRITEVTATGNGRTIKKTEMKPSVFKLPPIAWDKVDKDELDKLNKLAASTVGTVFTVSFVDGSIYQMQDGSPTGDVKGDGSTGTIGIEFQGEPNATRIS
jgi:hypothetical protein